MEFFPALLMGGLSAYIANSKGRSTIGWFAVGFFFPCVGLIVILALGNETAQRDLQQENRRLREKLRMDRTSADRRHRDTQRRLDVHDVALGVDTGERQDALHEHPQDAALEGADQTPNDRFYQVNWHYELDSQSHGPVSFDELKDLWLDNLLNPRSLVWNKHFSDWKSIEAVRDLEGELRA